MKHDTRLCWLPFLGDTVESGPAGCLDMARAELKTGLAALGVDTPCPLKQSPGGGRV